MHPTLVRDDLPQAAADHRRPSVDVRLRDHALAALAQLACPADAPAIESPEVQFLRQHVASGRALDEWPDAFYASLTAPSPDDAALIALARDLDFSDVELLSVVLAEAVEDDAMIGRVVAHLQAPLGDSRPTVALMSAAFAPLLDAGQRASDLISAGTARASGLIVLGGEGAPLPERPIAVPLHLCHALHGIDSAPAGTMFAESSARDVLLPPSIHRDAVRHAEALDGTLRRVLVIRTPSLSEGRACAHAIAHSLRRRPLFIDSDRLESLAPLLALRSLVPVFHVELGPGERKVLPDIPLHRGAVIVLCGPDGTVDSGGAPTAHWTLPVPSVDERASLWATALGNEMLATGLAREHRHGSGRIAHLGRLATHRATLDGRQQVTKDDVAASAWTVEGGGLDALAQPISDTIPDDAFVATPALREELRQLLLRCRVRDGLTDGLGASAIARYRPGVRALFVGPSGTGKTLAAAWLATQLGAPLYRVDLAAVTSKYIGETEKNLAQLLARAEQAEVILLFDEADSLFGKRTDVKDSNDRFANAQTNYLLQRIETFESIALLTSNSRSRFDSAFARRLDTIVDFPLPGPDERRALWQSHLGAGHSLSGRELNLLAARIDVAGGHIRNAVLTASVLAHGDGQLIGWSHVLQALGTEYRKLGRQLPAELQAPT